jgi:hypothetical protein
MSFCQVGDAVVYMNGAQSGVVRNGINSTYVKPPKTYYPDATREYNDPPVGHIVRQYAGRMWIAKGNVIYFSEPFGPNLYRLSVNYVPLPSKVLMIAPVLGGMFVSTASKIYFMRGSDPVQMQPEIVAHYPVIEGTDCEVDGIAVGGGQLSPLPMQMFTTTNGVCVGTSDGQLHNLTYSTLEYPPANRGSAVFTGSKYITCLGTGVNKLTLCISLDKVAPSQYANFNFSGMCRFGDRIIGGNDNGVYQLLTGNTDGNSSTLIDSHFRTGPTGFGVEHEKRLRKLYLSMRSSGRLEISVSADGKEDVTRDLTPHDNSLKIIHQEVAGGRDIKGKYLDLKVSNIQGSDFTISEIRAVMIIKDTKTTEVM